MPASWERWTVAGTSLTRRSPMIAGPATCPTPRDHRPGATGCPARSPPTRRDSASPGQPRSNSAGPLSIHLFTISEQHGGREVVAVLLHCHADPDARPASFDLPDAAPAALPPSVRAARTGASVPRRCTCRLSDRRAGGTRRRAVCLEPPRRRNAPPCQASSDRRLFTDRRKMRPQRAQRRARRGRPRGSRARRGWTMRLLWRANGARRERPSTWDEGAARLPWSPTCSVQGRSGRAHGSVALVADVVGSAAPVPRRLAATPARPRSPRGVGRSEPLEWRRKAAVSGGWRQ